MLGRFTNSVQSFLGRLRTRLDRRWCPIWPNFRARVQESLDGSLYVYSPRAGGRYEIDADGIEELSRLDSYGRARLTTWIINELRSGLYRTSITPEVIRSAFESQPLPVTERADRLLGHIDARIKESNAAVPLRSGFLARRGRSQSLREYTISIDLQSGRPLAWTESVEFQDVQTLFDHLREQGWVRGEISPERDRDGGILVGTEAIRCTITAEGLQHLEDLRPNANSNQAFVAMWLDPNMDTIYDLGIRPGIEMAGYRAYRVDREPAVDDVDEDIKKQVAQSRFVVADVTHGEKGPRASVYYEVGLAHSMGIPVIFTCQHGLLDCLPFDTRQRKHIPWHTGQEGALADRLREVIAARVGPPKRMETRPT